MSAAHPRRWRKVLQRSKRLGRLVACGIIGYDEAVADALHLSHQFGCGNDVLQHEIIAEAVDAAAMETELAAQKRIYDAVVPLIEGRRRSAVIMHEAHKANLGVLTPPVVKLIVKQLMFAALQAAKRRRKTNA